MQSNSGSQGAGGLIGLLLRSGEALRNWQALVTLMATGVAMSVISMAFASLGSGVLMIIGMLLAMALGAVGISATGILLTDQALGMAPRSFGAALLDGLFAALRLLVLGLIGLAAMLVVALVVSILLLLCKIPGIGGVLYAVILPVSILVMAFVYAALYFIFCLAGPAVWSGASIRQALAALYAVVKNRLFETALGIIFLILLMGMIGFLVGVFISSGAMLVGGLSVPILGGSFNAGSLSGMMMGAAMGGSGSGLIYGGAFGFGILMAVVGALLVCMTLLGLIRLYHHLTASLDLAHAEAELAQRMGQVKQRAAAVQEEARRRAEELRQRSQAKAAAAAPSAEPSPAPSPAPAAAPVCPACQAPVDAGDKFCGNCGQSLG